MLLYEDSESDRKTEKSWSTLLNDPELLYSGKMDTILRCYIICSFYVNINQVNFTVKLND